MVILLIRTAKILSVFPNIFYFSYERIMDFFNTTDFDSSIIPSVLRITTMSITFKIGKDIDIDNLDRMYPNPKKPFYNSISLKIPVDKENSREVHFKLFKNGSIQGAGFKSIENINFAMNELISRLQDTKPLNVLDKKIIMINVNFSFPFCIRRDVFFQCLVDDEISCFYDNCKHAAIKIMFKVEDKEKPIIIFVFQSGSVNIFGSKHHNHILGAYIYIKGLVEKHIQNIKTIGHDTNQTKFSHLLLKTDK